MKNERFRITIRQRLGGNTRVIAAAVGVVCSLGTLTSCAKSKMQASNDPSSSDPVGIFLGLDSVSNRRTSELARGQRIQLCMKRLGFAYVPFAFVVAAKRTNGGYSTNLRTHGYGIADAMEIEIPRDPNDDTYKNLPPADQAAYSVALDGKESEGARSVGCRQMAEGGAEADGVLTRIGKSESTFSASMNIDPEIRKIDAAWSECMRSKGYASLAHPAEVVANVVRPLQNRLLADRSLTSTQRADKLRPEELAVARVDAQCMPDPVRAARTKLVNTYRSALLEANRADFEKLRSYYR